jgi:hypothetical protein
MFIKKSGQFEGTEGRESRKREEAGVDMELSSPNRLQRESLITRVVQPETVDSIATRRAGVRRRSSGHATGHGLEASGIV